MGRQRLGREQLEHVGARCQRGIGLGQRGHAGRAGHASGARGADHIGVAVGHDDDLPTDCGHIGHGIDGERGACAHQAVGRQCIAQRADAGQRLGGVERHFDDAKPCVVQRVADGHHLVRLHTAQDGDEPAALQDVEQGFVDGVHAGRLPAVMGGKGDEDAGATTSPAASAICHCSVALACVAMVGRQSRRPAARWRSGGTGRARRKAPAFVVWSASDPAHAPSWRSRARSAGPTGSPLAR